MVHGLIALLLTSTARAEDLFTEGPVDLGLGNAISVADVNGDGWVVAGGCPPEARPVIDVMTP